MKVLLAGESWLTVSFHIKGFDYFVSSNYEEGTNWLVKALEEHKVAVDYLPNHLAPSRFPNNLNVLKEYDAVILSDIGSRTILLHPDTFLRSIPTVNRLNLLRDYVDQGGGLCMIGGYLSYQGIEAKGQWHGTPVEEVLPVRIEDTDDRVEVPEGFIPSVMVADHPILASIPGTWPQFLGYNKLTLKENATALLIANDDPFLSVGEYGKGRSVAFASDCAPHWGSYDFVNWKYYSELWVGIINWLARKI